MELPKQCRHMNLGKDSRGSGEKPEDYLYSSARDYMAKGKGLLDIYPI